MAYVKPSTLWLKFLNPVMLRFKLGPTAPLTVRRRRSGDLQRVPIIPVEHDGIRYVVSAHGDSDWVKNLRVAGECQLDGSTLAATELSMADGAAIVTIYRKLTGKASNQHWKRLPDPRDHPVFKLTSR